MRPLAFLFNALLFLLISLAIFSCTSIPTNPYDEKNTKITLFGKSTIQTANETSVADSVGNRISVGFIGNLPKYLDSVQLKIVLSGARDSVIKTYTDLTPLKSSDTTWDALVFSDTGTKTIIGTAFISGIASTFSDSITIIIRGKPINHRPSLTFMGPTSIVAGTLVILTVSASDTDSTQQTMIVMAQGPSGAGFISGIFTWTPSATFSGTDSAIFIVHDNGYPVMYDTAKVVFTVTSSSTTPTSLWSSKTINEPVSPGNTLTMTLLTYCSFPTGDVLTFTLLPGLPSTDSIANASTAPTYTFTPGPADTGVFHPQIVAKDSHGISDTLTITLRISVPTTDTLPPVITRVYPLLDSAKVSSNALAVTVRCTDPSGVAGVRCLMNADTFPVTSLDSGKYSATISGLSQGMINSILFVAVDASPRANSDTLIVHVKYDSTIADNTPPIITLIIPSKDTIISSDSSVVRVKCTDASGIASVVYSEGTQTFTATRSLPTDSVFSATVKGLIAGSYSTVTITATDASPAHNAATSTVRIKYDSDKTAPVLKLLLPVKDSASVSGNATGIQVVCKDPSGVASLTYGIGAAAPQSMTKSASVDSVWSANITGLTAGQFSTITIIAMDSSLLANKDTLFVHIKYDNDKTGPTIRRFDPAADSQSVSASSYAVKVVCKDTSGVASVVFGLGTASFPATKSSDSIWTATVTNLVSGAFNKITVTATDGSVSANVSTLSLSIKYDPTMTDNVPPIITLMAPSRDTIVTVDSFVVRVKCTDASGVASVIYTLGTQTFTATRSSPTDSIFSATVKGLSTAANPTVTITATDASTAANKGTKTVVLSFAIAAKITTALASTTTVNIGGSTALTIVAIGSPTPLYQWYFNGAVISSFSNSASYVKSWTAADAGTYKVIISNVAGQDSSSTVLSVVPPAPTISGITTGDGTAVVTWGAVTGATSYNLYYALGATVDKTTLTKVTGAVSPATVSSLTNGSQYAFAVSSVTASGESPLSAVMTATPQVYIITASAGTGGSISPTGSMRVVSGASQTFTITVSPGYTLTSVTVDGAADAAALAAKQKVFTNVTAAHTIAAAFAKKQFALTTSIVADAGTVTGSITATPPTSPYDSGSSVSLTAPTDAKYTFTGWTGTGLASATLTNPLAVVINGVTSLTANYTIKKFTVTFNSQGGSAVASQIVNYNATATSPTSPTLSCNTFAGWYKETAGINSWNFSTFVVIRDTTIYAKWTPAANPTVSVTPSSPICAGSNATFSAAITGGTAPFSYQWYQVVSGSPSPVGTNSSSLSISTLSETGGATQSYAISCYCTITDNCGKTATSSSANVSVNYLPDVPIVEFETDIDATLWLHCAVLQSNPSTYFCCWYRYNKNNTGWTSWSKTDGTNTCDGLSSTLGGAIPQNTVQFQAYIINTLTNCQSTTTTLNWPQ